MTKHLPECQSYRDECGGGCICYHVRACEKRVLDAAVHTNTNQPEAKTMFIAHHANAKPRLEAKYAAHGPFAVVVHVTHDDYFYVTSDQARQLAASLIAAAVIAEEKRIEAAE